MEIPVFILWLYCSGFTGPQGEALTLDQCRVKAAQIKANCEAVKADCKDRGLRSYMDEDLNCFCEE